MHHRRDLQNFPLFNATCCYACLAMRAGLADTPLSYEEYLSFDHAVDSRHEFIDGDILAMAGGTRRRAVLKSRLSAELTIGIRRGASRRVEDSDTRVLVERGGTLNAYYPEMVVICGSGETHSRDPDGGVINPSLIVEVTSPNTEKRDRGVKLDDYGLLSSLREYAIVSHLREEVELWSRKGPADAWTRRIYTAGEVVRFYVDVVVAIDDLYKDPLPPR